MPRLRTARLKPRRDRLAVPLRRSRLPPSPNPTHPPLPLRLPLRASRLRPSPTSPLHQPRRACPRPTCPPRDALSPPAATSPHAPSCRPSVPRRVSTSRPPHGDQQSPTQPNLACLHHPAYPHRPSRRTAVPYRHRRLRPDLDRANRSRRPQGRRVRRHAQAARTGPDRPADSADQPPVLAAGAASAAAAERRQRPDGPTPARPQVVPADPPAADQADRVAAPRGVAAAHDVVVAASAKNCSLSSSRHTPPSMLPSRRARLSSSAAPRPKTSHPG